MFGNSVLKISHKIRGWHYETDEYEYCGIPVTYEQSRFKSDAWGDWAAALEKWMPVFDEAGWLDHFGEIRIGDRFVPEYNIGGRYKHGENVVLMGKRPGYSSPPLVSTSLEYGLIHEMVHHAHLTREFGSPPKELDTLELTRKQESLDFVEMLPDFKYHVSDYAGADFMEAVAETCAGLALGNEYPEEIHLHYRKLGGPTPITDGNTTFKWNGTLYQTEP